MFKNYSGNNSVVTDIGIWHDAATATPTRILFRVHLSPCSDTLTIASRSPTHSVHIRLRYYSAGATPHAVEIYIREYVVNV